MSNRAAKGNDALLGLLIDEIVATGGNVGHPHPIIEVTAAVAAPTSATSGVGLITGTVTHYVVCVCYSGRTVLSSGTVVPLVCTSNAVTVTLAASASTECYAREIWRSDLVHTTPYWVGTVYDNSTLTFADNIATDDASLDFFTTAPAFNETGKNAGFVFLRPDSIGIDPKYGYIKSKALSGSTGEPKGAPGNIDVPVTFKQAMESGFSVPILASVIGKPTVTNNADGTNQYVFSPSISKLTPVSTTYLLHEGLPMRPEMALCSAFSEIDVTVKGNSLVEMVPKGMAIQHALSGIPINTVGSTAKTAPMVKGIRTDSLYATSGITGDLYVKVTTAPSAGTFVIKCKIGSAASYGSTAITITYDTTTKKQVQTGSQTSDWIELIDSNTGLRYGADTGEARRPFMILFPGDVTAHYALNDEFKFYNQANALVPGYGTTPGTADGTFTGFGARRLFGPRFTNCHGALYYGLGALSSPTTYLEAENFKFKIDWKIKPTHPVGREGAAPTDFDRDDFLGFQIDLERRYISRFFQVQQEQDLRLSVLAQLQGELPIVQPGVRSANRLTFQVASLQMRVDNAATPIGGPNVLHETISLVAEQNDDTAYELFTATLIDGVKRWNFRTA